MKPKIQHPWPTNEATAIELQRQLASQIITEDQFSDITLIAGVDVAYSKDSDKLIAAVVVLDSRTLDVIESQTAIETVQFPYIPGLFSFRELPALMSAMANLENQPDLVVCDGQGLAHPRRFGLASHLGLLFDIPSIGCGKTRLCGAHGEVGLKRGNYAELSDNGDIIGCALRTQDNINPVYVSIGHRISLQSATDWILKLSPKFRLPETTRKADQLVNMSIRALQNSSS